jgi:hypothetical protein
MLFLKKCDGFEKLCEQTQLSDNTMAHLRADLLPSFSSYEPDLSYSMHSRSVSDQFSQHYGNDLGPAYSPSGVLPLPNPLASTDNYSMLSFDPPPPYTSYSHNFPSSDPTVPSMGPPTKRRKKKAPTSHAHDWEPYRARIIELHIEQGIPLRAVKGIIEEEFKFTAEFVSFLRKQARSSFCSV